MNVELQKTQEDCINTLQQIEKEHRDNLKKFAIIIENLKIRMEQDIKQKIASKIKTIEYFKNSRTTTWY